MRHTISRLGIAVACSALVVLPGSAQSTGSPAEGPTAGQQDGSSDATGPTDQQGSTHGDQIGSEQERDRTREPAEETTGAAGAEDDRAGSSGSSAATDDRAFVVKAAGASMAEVRLGHLAAEKASHERVKRFGQVMVDDHAKVNEELMAIARELNLSAPHALRPEDQEAYERLSKLTGAAFDRAFLEHMLKDHQSDLQMFRQHATTAKDPRVREFAQSKLPILEQHYERARQLQQFVKAEPGAAATSGTMGTSGERDRVNAGEEDDERDESHVHEGEPEGPEEQPGTSTGTPPQ